MVNASEVVQISEAKLSVQAKTGPLLDNCHPLLTTAQNLTPLLQLVIRLARIRVVLTQAAKLTSTSSLH